MPAAFEHTSKTRLPYYGSRLSIDSVDLKTARLPFVPSADDFNPRKYRDVPEPLKPWLAYFDLIRLGFGPGFLGIPLAISQAGIVMGPIICITIGLILAHTQIMMLNCLNEVSRQLKVSRVSYRYGFRICLLHGPPLFHCLGNFGPTIIGTFMFLSQISICTVCYIFTADTLRDIMDWPSSVPAMLILLLPYLFLQHYLRTMMQFSIVAVMATSMTFMGLAIIFFHIFQSPHGEYIPIKAHIVNLSFSFSTVLFNMSSVGIILAFDRGLENPELMVSRYGIIRIGVMIPSIFAAIFGSLGYWSFGTMEENILRSLPYDEPSTIVCMSLYLVVVVFTYSIQSYPGTLVILDFMEQHDPMIVPTKKTLKRVEAVMRPLFVFITFLICYLIPFQGPFVSFCGSLCTNLLAIVFPCMMEICLLYPNRYGYGEWILIKDILLIVVGMVGFVAGILTSSYLIFIREKALLKSDAFEKPVTYPLPFMNIIYV